MKKILLATTNERKVKEADAACRAFGITVEQVKLEIDEIQSHDPVKIARRKAEDAYKQTKQPVVVTDTSWNIPALNGFPGGYMKDIMQWFGADDFFRLIEGRSRDLSFTEIIVYCDGQTTRIFSQEFPGRITDSVKSTNGNSIEQVAEFNGYTIAERRDRGKLTHEPEDYIWHQFAKWYSSNSYITNTVDYLCYQCI